MFFSVIASLPDVLQAADALASAVTVKIVEGGESTNSAATLRRVIVGPGVNEPAPFPGYGGTLAWSGITRANDGALVVAFNAGYWHASPPTPYIMSKTALDRYYAAGMPRNVVAPTGGRLMFIRSTDGGRTWTKPQTLIDTPADDRQAGLLALPDGSIVTSFFTSYGDVDSTADPAFLPHTMIIKSSDNGLTWEKAPHPLISKGSDAPFYADAADGPAVLCKDQSILLTAYGGVRNSGNKERTVAGVFTSKDRGATWRFLSTIAAAHSLEESHAVELPNGQMVMISRPEGDICWSSDGGHSWTEPVAFGIRMFAPTLYVMGDGTLVCLHGSYVPGHAGMHALLSADGGHTWIAPARDRGFLVDADAYGYGAAVLMPDNTLLMVYQHTGSHRTKDATENSLLLLRLRIRADHSGIDLLAPY